MNKIWHLLDIPTLYILLLLRKYQENRSRLLCSNWNNGCSATPPVFSNFRVFNSCYTIIFLDDSRRDCELFDYFCRTFGSRQKETNGFMQNDTKPRNGVATGNRVFGCKWWLGHVSVENCTSCVGAFIQTTLSRDRLSLQTDKNPSSWCLHPREI